MARWQLCHSVNVCPHFGASRWIGPPTEAQPWEQAAATLRKINGLT